MIVYLVMMKMVTTPARKMVKSLVSLGTQTLLAYAHRVSNLLKHTHKHTHTHTHRKKVLDIIIMSKTLGVVSTRVKILSTQ